MFKKLNPNMNMIQILKLKIENDIIKNKYKELIGEENMEDYKKSMDGIYTTSVNEETIDEAPMVYKPMEEIIEHIKDTVDIEKVIKPIYNFKSNE